MSSIDRIIEEKLQELRKKLELDEKAARFIAELLESRKKARLCKPETC